jgi:hypothetical protein
VTSKKQLKARVRARMTRTGEAYTTARRHVAGASTPVVDHGYTLRGGLHPESANITNVLAHHGVTIDGRALSEALVFGVGGGPGAAYILWEFSWATGPSLVLGFRSQGHQPDAWTTKTLDRLSVRYEAEHTGAAVAAARRLTELIDRRIPCIIRPDRAGLGYWRLRQELFGFGGHDVVVFAEHDGQVHVDDRNVSPLTVPRPALDASRARVGSYKNSLYVIDPATGPITAETLRVAVRAGIVDCVENYGGSSDSFALPAWRKWARLMTDAKNAKGWPKVFAGGKGLAGTLLNVWEGILPMGMTGGHLRELYAGFLDDAAEMLSLPALRGVAEQFRLAAHGWESVAAIALPDDVPELARLRDLTTVVREAVADPSRASKDEADQAAAEVWTLLGQLDAETPFDEAAKARLFEALGAAVGEVYTREKEAVRQLAAAIGRA